MVTTRFAENLDTGEIIIPANRKIPIFSERLSGSQKWSIKKITAKGPKEAKIVIMDDDVPINRHCQKISGFPIKLGHDPYNLQPSSSINITAENTSSEDIVVQVIVEAVRFTNKGA